MLELAFIAELNIIATRVALGAIAIALAASCGGPKVHSFMLEPRNVCRGQAPGSTRISWSVSGTPSLRVRYGRAANDEPDEPDTLTFLLVVTKGRDSVTEREDVLEFPAQFAHTIAIPATSQGSDVVAAGETNPAQWPAVFVVHTVRSGSSRAINVVHGGRTASVGANGAESAAFQGTPLAGSWQLKSAVASGDEPPDRLRLQATVSCVP